MNKKEWHTGKNSGNFNLPSRVSLPFTPIGHEIRDSELTNRGRAHEYIVKLTLSGVVIRVQNALAYTSKAKHLQN